MTKSSLRPHDNCKNKKTQSEMTSMPLKSGLRYFYFNSNKVVTLCMQKRNIKEAFGPKFFCPFKSSQLI
jgi:hypothetical protein